MGRPLVMSRVGGLPEIVEHQENGLLVEQDDADGLAEAISFLLAHPAAAIQMGKAARRRIETVFSWDRHVNAYDALYQTLSKPRMTAS